MKLRIARGLDITVEYLIYGLVFFIPISIAMISIFAGMAIVLFLIKKILSPDFSSIKANKTLFWFFFLFFAFLALSVLNSGHLITKSLKALLIKWGRWPLLFWVIIETFQDTRRIIKAAHVFLFSMMLVGLSAFSQKFFGWEFLRGKSAEYFTGPFKTQNGLSAYLTCVIPIVLSLALCKWKRIATKLWLLLVTVLLILCSFWADCRGGWVGLISGLIFVFLAINYLHNKRKIFWSLFLASFLIFLPLITWSLLFITIRGDSFRFTLFQGAWQMIKENPLLGKGVGTFMDYCASYTNNLGTFYAHNCYLQIWAESGIFALLSFILFAGYVIIQSIKVSSKIPESLSQRLLIGLTAGLLGYLAHGFFEIHLYSFQLSFLFWTVLGLTVALSYSLEQGLAGK